MIVTNLMPFFFSEVEKSKVGVKLVYSMFLLCSIGLRLSYIQIIILYTVDICDQILCTPLGSDVVKYCKKNIRKNKSNTLVSVLSLPFIDSPT